MFTIDQVKSAHSKVKSGGDFPAYIQELKQLGVKNYTTYVADGHTEFTSIDNKELTGAAKYDQLIIAGKTDNDIFRRQLKEHQAGGSDYPTFCGQAAATGVHKWIVDLQQMTCTYYDLAGNEMLVEQVPVPE